MFSIVTAFSISSSSTNAGISAERMAAGRVTFGVRDYDLAATLMSGQSFRWQFCDGGWNGVIRDRWVRLRADEFSITAEAARPVADWSWLAEYLQLDLDVS